MKKIFYMLTAVLLLNVTFVFGQSLNDTTLIAFYPFNGNANDSTQNHIDGDTLGVTITPDRFGNPESAYSFDGIDDYILVDTTFALENVSVSFWVKSKEDSMGYMVNYYQGRMKGWGIAATDTSVSIYDDIKNADNRHYNSIIDTSWHHITALIDSLENRFYIDGVLVGSGDSSKSTWTSISSGQLFFGKRGNGVNNHFEGSIDDVRIYNCALTETEIDSLYHEHGWAYITNIPRDEKAIPEAFDLKQNYPNPFNPETTISFEIQKAGQELLQVNLSVYDIIGQKVVTLIDKPLAPNAYSVKWNGRNEFGQSVPSGTYFYVLKTEAFSSSRKMMLIK